MTAATNGPASSRPSMTYTHEKPDAVAKQADTAGVLQALARILERAHALLAEGYSPDIAILAALAEHQPRLALARVARAAWAIALHEESRATALEGLDQQGGRS